VHDASLYSECQTYIGIRSHDYTPNTNVYTMVADQAAGYSYKIAGNCIKLHAWLQN